MLSDVLLSDVSFAAAGTVSTGNCPTWVAVADFNGDGKSDLAVANANSHNLSVLLGKGDGTFQAKTDYATGSSPYSVTVGDFNGDTKSDLVVSNNNNGTVSILLGKGDGTFQARTAYAAGSGPYSVVVGDFNRDGKSDLAVANYSDSKLSILLGKGDGTFQNKVDYPVDLYVRSVAVGDFNGDGKIDLAVANSTGTTVSVLPGNGDGTFQVKTDYAAGNSPYCAAVGDFNGDGRSDLAVANYYGTTVSVLLNTTPIANEAPMDISLSSRSIAENKPAGTVVGRLSTTDPDMGDNFTYSLVSGLGATDNAAFTIGGVSGDQLKTAAAFVYRTRKSYSIRVQTTDAGGLSFEKAFTIAVTHVNINPVSYIYDTTTAVTASNSTYGQSVTFTAKVTSSAGIPTGSFQYLIDGTSAGAPVTLAGDGSATYTMSGLNAGSYAITARYSGDANFGASVNGVTQVVNPAALTVSASPQSKTYGQVNPTLTGTLMGVIGEDGITASYSHSATQFSHAGDYVITPALNDPNGKLGNYTLTLNSGTLAIGKADQIIAWATPAPILLGTALSDAQLNATVTGVAGGSSAGVLSHGLDAGVILDGGNHTLTVTAGATADYNEATLSVNQMVQIPLVISGTAGDDRIVVKMNGDMLVWRVNGVAARMPVADVSSIRILAGAGNDTVLINPGVMGVVILGGDGNDTLTGGDGSDRIKGGAGNDLIHGGRGDDLLLGGAGDDMLYGDAGNDTLDGGAGRDTLRGQRGADTLYARDGEIDILFGGPGRNTAFVDDLLDRRAQIKVLA